MFLSNIRVKSPMTKKIENNIFEGMTYRLYILLYKINKKNVVHLNDVLIVLRQYLDESI